jgi:hypothetical protein
MLKALPALVLCAVFVACARPVKLRPDVLASAAKLKDVVPPPSWSIGLGAATADLMEPIGDDNLLVGAVVWNDKFASFRRGPVQLVELATGKVRWKVDPSALPSGQSVLVTEDPLIVIATVAGDATIVTGLDRESGTVLWNRRFGRRAAYVLSPVLARPSLLVVDDQAVHAVELATGVNRWSTAIQSSSTPLGFSAWLAPPAVYMITDRLQRLSIDGGRLDWSSGENVDGPVTQAIRVSDQLITVGAAAITSFSTIDGRVSWRHAREGLKPIAVGIAGVNLLVGWTHTTSSIASELTLHDTMGTLIWHSEPLAELRGGPVIDDDGFIVVTTAAQALRIDARSGAIVAKAKLPLELIGKRGLPDYLSFHNRDLHVRRERGVAVVDLATMKIEWSLPVLAGRALEWSVSEKLHNAWLLGNSAIPQTTAALLTTSRRAEFDALHALTLSPDQRLPASETVSSSDALHLYLAAQSQAYLDDGRAAALYAGANMRSAEHDFFASGPSLLATPVQFRDQRNGVLLVDSVKKAAGVVWAGPRIDDDVAMVHLDRKNGLVVVVAPGLDPKEQKAYRVRGKVKHTVSIAAFPLLLSELRDGYVASRASAELTGVDPAQVEIPRFIVAREGQRLAERYPDHGCVKDYAAVEFLAGTLGHYAAHADDADLLVSLVRNDVKLDAPTKMEVTVAELAQLVSRPDTIELIKAPRPTRNDALRSAAAQGNTTELLRLLSEDGDPNTGLFIPGCDFGPLHFAIVKNNARMVDALLKAGAWVNYATPEGSALDLALNYNASKTIVTAIKNKGGRPGPPMRKPEPQPETGQPQPTPAPAAPPAKP